MYAGITRGNYGLVTSFAILALNGCGGSSDDINPSNWVQTGGNIGAIAKGGTQNRSTTVKGGTGDVLEGSGGLMKMAEN